MLCLVRDVELRLIAAVRTLHVEGVFTTAATATIILLVGDITNLHATVNLAMPQETLFLADQKQPTASVMLTLNGGGFNDAAVRGVQRLVANAVTGLTPANVEQTDSTGLIREDRDSR